MSEANIIIEHESDGGHSISLAENAGKMNIRVDRETDVESVAGPPRRAERKRAPPPQQQQRQRQQQQQQRPVVAPPVVARPYVPGADAFKDFANPTKRRTEEFARDRDESSVGGDGESVGEDGGASSFGDAGGGGMRFEGDDGSDGEAFDDEIRPSLGFKSIEEEKHDIILKLHRLKQRGFPVTRNFTLTSDIYEMRTELSKIKYNIELDASVKFSRKMLMGAVSTIEFVNKKWNPFDLALEGWSENMMETMDDYDLIFEKLHDKYKDKVSMPPEMELLLAVSGSAFMYHLSHSMLRSLGPEIAAKIKKNPEIVKSAMREAVAEDQQKRAEHERNQRQMKGPQIPTPTPPTPPPPPVQMPTFEPPPHMTPQMPTEFVDPPRPRPRAPTPPSSSISEGDSFDSRMSDVPSEDLKSVASSLDMRRRRTQPEVKTVTVAPRAARGGGKGRGRGGGRGGRGAAATDAVAKEIRVLNI